MAYQQLPLSTQKYYPGRHELPQVREGWEERRPLLLFAVILQAHSFCQEGSLLCVNHEAIRNPWLF